MSRKQTATEAMQQEYYRIVNDSANEGITCHNASVLAAEQVNNLIDAGLVHEPDRIDALKLEAQRFDKAQKRVADSILAALAGSEGAPNIPPLEILRTIVTLGGGKRKAWRYVTGADLDLMTEERSVNVKRQQHSFRSWHANARSISGVVAEYHTVGDALDASALPLIPA